MRLACIALTLALLAAGAQSAAAQSNDFKFEERPAEAVDGVEWVASAQGGLILTTGNSQTTTLSAGVKASRKQGFNKFSIEGGLSFARSTILIANDANGNGTIDNEAEIDRETQTTNEAYSAKGRYDRFLTETDSVFATAGAAVDKPAGRDLVLAGQLGYSRQLFKDEIHALVSEAGFEVSREDLAAGDASTIGSIRLFAGYTGKLSEDTGLSGDVEVLLNVNSVDNGSGTEAGTFEDARVNGNVALTTKMFKDISFRFALGIMWDNYPAPRPPLGIGYAAGFVPLADELDTKAEASLIVNFL